jgi:hypothetical protein
VGTLSGSELRLNASFSDSDGGTITQQWTLTKGSSSQKDAKITIRNESSFWLMYPRWSRQSFINLEPSSYETQNAATGSGYLTFNLSTASNWIECRTHEVITVSKGENKVFVITDNTIAIDINDATNTPKTIREIESHRKPILGLQNMTSFYLLDITWNGESFYYMNPSYQYEPEPPYIQNKDVDENSGYLFFTITVMDNSIPVNIGNYRTHEMITLSNGETKIFVITDNTLVVGINDATNTPQMIQEIASSVP